MVGRPAPPRAVWAGRPLTVRIVCSALLLVAQWSLLPAESSPGNSGAPDRLQMPSKTSGGAQSISEELRQRGAALSRLFDADEEWWDGIEVDVPWAAVCDGMDSRRDTWLGVITDCDTADNVLDSIFTIENEDDDETVVHVDSRELAGLVAFGKHGVQCLVGEIAMAQGDLASPQWREELRPGRKCIALTLAQQPLRDACHWVDAQDSIERNEADQGHQRQNKGVADMLSDSIDDRTSEWKHPRLKYIAQDWIRATACEKGPPRWHKRCGTHNQHVHHHNKVDVMEESFP